MTKSTFNYANGRIIVLLFFTMLSCSCSFINTTNNIPSFEETPVTFPTSGVVIKEGKVSEYNDSIIKGKTFVIFIDSSECTDCRLSKMRSFDKLRALGDNTASFDMVCIITPPSEQKESVTKKIVHYSKFDSMTYVIDTEGAFSYNNPLIFPNGRYHHFLVNEGMYPIFVGNPTESQRLFKSFIKALL